MVFGFLRLIHMWLSVLMAYSGAKQPDLSGFFDAKNLNKKRFHVVKSSLLSKLVPSDINGDYSLPESPPLYLSIKQLGMYVGIYITVGTMCFYAVRDDIKGKKSNGIIDALYLCTTTMTSVGFGDLVPAASLAKVLSMILAVIGMGITGLVMSKAADFEIQIQELSLLRTLQKYYKLGPGENLNETKRSRIDIKLAIVAGVLAINMFVGTSFLYGIEDMDFIDAFYAASLTMTTLGYGDKAFSTRGGRLFAVFWILTSTVGLSQLFLSAIDFFGDARRRAMLKWITAKKMITTDMEAVADDEAGVFAIAEFVIYKLREMGKITEEDISVAMQDFEDVGIKQPASFTAAVEPTESKQ